MAGHQVFISYQRQDQGVALRLYDRLLSDRYWVWIDKQGLEPFRKWEPQIEENLRKSYALIALISSNSVRSDWVKHEGSMAYALRRDIIPVKIEPFGAYSAEQLPLWVGKLQLLDLIEGSGDYEDKYHRLKRELGAPLPFERHFLERLRHYQESGALLDEVELDLVDKHYGELRLTGHQKRIAAELIRESRFKLEKYWVRYDKLNNAYKMSLRENLSLKQVVRNLDSASVLYKLLWVISVVALFVLLFMFLYYFYEMWLQSTLGAMPTMCYNIMFGIPSNRWSSNRLLLQI